MSQLSGLEFVTTGRTRKTYDLSHDHILLMDQQREIMSLIDPLEPPFWDTSSGYMAMGALISGSSLILLILSLLCVLTCQRCLQTNRLPLCLMQMMSRRHRYEHATPSHSRTDVSYMTPPFAHITAYDLPPSYESVISPPVLFLDV